MQVVAALALFSVLVPVRVWVAPGQSMNVKVQADGDVALVLTDFTGKPAEARAKIVAKGGQMIDLLTLYPDLTRAGTFVLWAVPMADKLNMDNFAGTPLVISVRADKRPGAPLDPMVTKIDPLRYATMMTDHGAMTMVFYYDVAPITTESFLSLSAAGYYDGLTFHRIVPNFVVQGGDPRGTGTGGPGYHVEAEFNDKKHEEGTLSMARNGDPLEREGARPRAEYANSAGSQFFICLAYTQHLDGRYTAFGKVVEGNETYKSMAKIPLANEREGRPTKPPVIQSITVKPVTARENPYKAIMPNFGQVPTKGLE
jgi:peptidyl-prolyl cis-trans isomerase B (cyclophilin B)